MTLLYFILLIPLAGFIAYAGDYIGHRTGKRRHSLFGLRPRHTALVFTIASGMAIVCVAFGAFWLFSESFRVVVRNGEHLYRNNLSLKQDNDRQAADIARNASRLSSMQQDALRLDRERVTAEKARNEALANAKEAEGRRLEAENKRKSAEGLQKQAQDNFERAESDLNAARADLNAARRNLSTTEINLGDSRKELQGKEQRVRVAEDRLKTAEAEQKDAKERVAKARSEQANAETQAKQAQILAAKQVGEARKELDAAKNQLAGLRKQLADEQEAYSKFVEMTADQRSKLASVNEELVQKRQEYEKLVANTAALRGRQITFQVGEEVDRMVIKPGMNVWKVQYALEAFLTAAARKAEGRGAARGSLARAVIATPLLIATAASEKGLTGPRVSSEEDTLNAAANMIRSRNQDTLIRAVATTNAVLGEPVLVELRIDPNPVVLKKDARIGEIILNGEKSRQEIADAVYTFLTRDIHKKLLTAGMLPPTTGAEDTAGDFWLSGEEWFRLIDDIRKGGSRPKLTVHAAKDLRAGDPVQLRFSVRTTVPWNNPPPID